MSERKRKASLNASLARLEDKSITALSESRKCSAGIHLQTIQSHTCGTYRHLKEEMQKKEGCATETERRRKSVPKFLCVLVVT